jgi:hypothetical protein
MHCSVACHLSWLGGQYGEEGKGEDETGGQEDRGEEDQAEGRQEEEVVIRRFLRLAQCQAQRRICRRGRKPAIATAANRPADKTTTEGVGENGYSLYEACSKGPRKSRAHPVGDGVPLSVHDELAKDAK